MISPELTTFLDSENASSPATLQVDVIADLICPWCYLGKRRLDDALSAVQGPSHVSWYPFQINPAMPLSGMALDEYLEKRFGNASFSLTDLSGASNIATVSLTIGIGDLYSYYCGY